MPIGVRAKSASVAVAILVTAIIGAPAFAIEQPDAGGTGVIAFAKPSDRPRPSHPHATPTPGPTPDPTPKATPKITPPPNPTSNPEPTPRSTDRPRENAPTAKPSKPPSASSGTSATGSLPSDAIDPGLIIGDSGGVGSTRPSPEVLGLAIFLAAIVGLGSLWLLTRRRRRRPAAPRPVAARAAAAPSAAGWTNVRLDDNEALPSWLRAIAEPERAPLLPNEPLFSIEPPPVEPAREREHADRPARTFAEPLEPGAMRLAVTANETELLDQPSDIGVTLTTLIAGDEVEIKDLEEPWVRVVTPVGSTGWLRATTLGVGGPAPDEPVPVEPPAQPEPRRRVGQAPRRTGSAPSAT